MATIALALSKGSAGNMAFEGDGFAAGGRPSPYRGFGGR